MVADMTAIEIYTDAIRWWGFLAGVFGLDDFRRRIIAWRAAGHWIPIRLLWVDACAKALTCMFLVFAGFFIPFTSRPDLVFKVVGVIEFSMQSPSFLAIMATAWTCISAAGWAYVISRAYRVNIMVLCACIALFSCQLASIATAGG